MSYFQYQLIDMFLRPDLKRWQIQRNIVFLHFKFSNNIVTVLSIQLFSDTKMKS